MITDKEKQAISRLTNIAQEKNSNWLGLSNIKAIETVLNLVETQQKELEKKDKRLNRQFKLLQKKDNDIHRMQELLDISDANNIKKDKIIDKMSEQLAGIAIWNNHKEQPLILGSKEEVIEYYERKVEENYDG